MMKSDLMSLKRIRLIGLLYLLVIILAGFSQGYVRGGIVIPNDAAQTAENILANQGLFRLGIITDLLAFMLDAAISVLLYQLFKAFGKSLAMLSAAFRLIAHPAIGSLNLIFHYLSIQLLGGEGSLLVFQTEELEAMSLLFLKAHQYGYLIAGGFFGIHCLLLGILIYRSDIFPKVFGGFMLGAAVGYLVETFTNFGWPGYEGLTALIVGVSAALGEVSLTFYMLIKGAKAAYRTKLKKLRL